jgi:hypothetical protein
VNGDVLLYLQLASTNSPERNGCSVKGFYAAYRQGGITVPKPKGTAKGHKQLCDGLSFIAGANLEIADDALKAGDTKAANEALDVAAAATADQKKWGCSGTARMSRARKKIASLKRALGRRRPGRSVGHPR